MESVNLVARMRGKVWLLVAVVVCCLGDVSAYSHLVEQQFYLCEFHLFHTSEFLFQNGCIFFLSFSKYKTMSIEYHTHTFDLL